jgi:SAM-dependent methyltransferase
MSNSYQLDSKDEAIRLEEQSSNENYSVENELKVSRFSFSSNDLVLDAGCGTGLLSRTLVDLYRDLDFKIHAIDLTESLLSFAKDESKKDERYLERIHFNKKDITNLRVNEQYDKVLCRFVFQHLPDSESKRKAAKSLFDSLRPNGELLVIDSYGFFSHMDTPNEWLREMIKFVESKLPIDMDVGIKLRGLFLDLGVKKEDISMIVQNFNFTSEKERIEEESLWRQRFRNAFPLLTSILKEEDAVRFSEEYCREVLNPRTFIFSQKFIVKVKKSP